MLDSAYNELKTIDDILHQQCQCQQVVDSISSINNHPGCPGDIEDIEDIIGALDYYEPKGKHICELPSASKMIVNDLFLVSQLSGRAWTSRKQTYASLKAKLLEDLLGAFNLGSMAYESKSRYALTSHNHNGVFNLVSWNPNQRYVDGSVEVSCLGKIQISTETLTATDISSNPSCKHLQAVELSVNCPKYQIPFPPEPTIGTLKFISSKTIQHLVDTNQLNFSGTNVDPYNGETINDEFDGWVFPNGQQLANKGNQLSSAAFVFAGNTSAASFTLPSLTSFFQASGKASGHSNSEIEATLGLSPHAHSISPLTLTCTLEADKTQTKLSSTDANGGGKWIHTGDNRSGASGQEQTMESIVTLDGAKLVGLSTDTVPQSSSADDWHPKHILLPMMIYIGGVTRKHYELL